MTHYLYIAAGGAAGAVLRYSMSGFMQQWLGRGFPYGTLFVNVSGSILIGVLYVLFVERSELDTSLRLGLIVGLLGAFTTFSTFSFETINLIEAGAWFKAGMNIFISVLLCVAGCWTGMAMTRVL